MARKQRETKGLGSILSLRGWFTVGCITLLIKGRARLMFYWIPIDHLSDSVFFFFFWIPHLIICLFLQVLLIAGGGGGRGYLDIVFPIPNTLFVILDFFFIHVLHQLYMPCYLSLFLGIRPSYSCHSLLTPGSFGAASPTPGFGGAFGPTTIPAPTSGGFASTPSNSPFGSNPPGLSALEGFERLVLCLCSDVEQSDCYLRIYWRKRLIIFIIFPCSGVLFLPAVPPGSWHRNLPHCSRTSPLLIRQRLWLLIQNQRFRLPTRRPGRILLWRLRCPHRHPFVLFRRFGPNGRVTRVFSSWEGDVCFFHPNLLFNPGEVLYNSPLS